MKEKQYAVLVGFFAATFVAAAIGSSATIRNVGGWYETLQKPAWTPPSALFSPVWITLYIMMSIAGWRAWRNAAPMATRGVIRLYGAQLILNALWSVLFFGMRRPDLALIDIFALWLLLLLGLIRFWRLDRLAGILWAPYVVWVSYAAALNFAIWQMNR
jgi:translocator protein